MAFSARILLPALMLFWAGCQTERTYEVRGRVVGFGDDDKTLIVEHADVRDLMPAMTMPFTVSDTSSIDQLSVGDAVAFRLAIASDSAWIHSIRELPDDAVPERPAGVPDASSATQTPILQTPILETGEMAPQIDLVTHADTTLNLAELNGRAVLITFIYTRCPLPDYCPLLSQRFAALQEVVASRYGKRVHLLSVSIDPSHDTPTVLREYAERYTDDLSTWTFASGDSLNVREFAASFGVFYAPGQGELVHNLLTVLVGPKGRIHRYWRVTDWKPDEVFAEIDRITLNPDLL